MTPDATVLALVPHFRCERWLDHCLSSLVEQTRPPDGIVVIDDASPEPPTRIVRRFPGVTLLRCPYNVGPYRLIQQVINDTSFDWYLFQDADDWSAKDRLARLLARAHESGAELVGSDYLMLVTDEGLTIPHAFPSDPNAALIAAPTCHALQHPTSMVRRTLVERLGGYASGLPFSGDDEFLRRAAHVAKVANSPRILYYQHHRPESLTTSLGTGHGSAARSQLLKALGERARQNAAAVQRGDEPRLEPYALAPPVELEHLCGPDPGRPTRRFFAPLGAVRRARHRLRRRCLIGPTLVTGGVASGADTLLWALAQHPSLSPLLDVSWLASVTEAAEQTGERVATRHLALSADRQLRPLDMVDTSPEKARRALASAVTQLVTGDSGDGSWLALVPPSPTLVGALLRLFPDGRVIHVVRDAGGTAAALARRSKANTDPLPLDDAYQAWLDAVRGGLQCEQTAGAGRLLRVRFDDLLAHPEESVARCTKFLGLVDHPACARLVENLDVAVNRTPAGCAAEAAAVQELGIALFGPPETPLQLPVQPVDEAVLDATSRSQEPRPSRLQSRPAPDLLPLPDPVSRPAALLRATVPAGAVVAVVTKGEGRFLELDGLEVWHFPQTPDGQWAGYHPADTKDIVRHLEEVRRRGARYFLVPYWASWWFDHYAGLRDHLLSTGRLLEEGPQEGAVFLLGPERADAAPQRAKSESRGRRHSVSVLSWNTTHNPLGRAYVLADLLRERYDVELVGARFDHFGTETWGPLRDIDIPLRSFAGGPFPGFLRQLEDFARTITSDVILVSKPRLPSYLLGMMAKAVGDRPLILDVDDRELTFVGATGPRSLEQLHARGSDELSNPHGRWWTQLCESLVGSADQVTVSNEILRALFGGIVVPHARDERVFDPSRVDRTAARARLGFADDERVILFGGTPRRHKGVIELVKALRQINDRRARLCLIGTPELDDMWHELAPDSNWITVVPTQPFAALPALLAAVDLVAVLQDPSSDVSQYQMPAKITDALAMEVPCLPRRVPPLEPLLTSGHLEGVGDQGLAATLSSLLDDLDGARERAHGNRSLFLSDYSFRAVRPRLEAVVESVLGRPSSIDPAQAEVVAFARERFCDRRPSAACPSRKPKHGRSFSGGDSFDIVMFWKQHDTGLYGRRHDMFMKYLVRSPQVGQVVQFDAPVDIANLVQPDSDLPTHTALVRERTMERIAGIQPLPGLHQHSFVYAPAGGTATSYPRREEYLVHVKEALGRHGVGERPVVFWVYPKHFEFPEIARAFCPDLILADVIDDHRTWLRPDDPKQERVLRNYEEIAAMSDVTLVNCAPMRDLMAAITQSVHLVPNAAEYPDPAMSGALDVPEELRSLHGPIVGYVGNLSSRIDVDLLDRLASSRADWNLVLIGSTHAGQTIAPLARHQNVTLLGPRPYEEAKRYIRAFDVAIIPHLDDAMTRSMNPLKAFVYCALQVPVVSTEIGNLGDLRSLISVAADHQDFVDKVDAAIGAGRASIDSQADAILRQNSWETRTKVVIDLIDEALGRTLAER